MIARADRLLPLIVCAVGALVTLAAILIFGRIETIRDGEEHATGAITALVDAVGLQAGLALEIGMAASLVPDADDPAAARRALRRAIAIQNEALADLKRRLTARIDAPSVRDGIAATAVLLREVEARALAFAADGGDAAQLSAATRAVLARSVSLSAAVTREAEALQRGAHSRQAALEAVAALLFGLLILGCLLPALFLLQRQKRRLARAAAELGGAAEELTVMSEMVQVAPWHIDDPAGAVRWSARLRSLLDLPDGVEPSLDATLGLFEPASAARLAERVARCWATGEGWDVELASAAPAGGRRIMRCFGQAVREHGVVVSISAALQDVTDRSLARERFDALQQRLSIATEGAGIGLWDWMPKTDEAWYSDTWSTMLGYEPGERASVVGGWFDLVHPDDAASARDRLGRHLCGETPDYRTEFRMRAADNSWRWILAVGRVVERDAQGAPTRVSGLHLDLTERREAEAALADSEARFRALAAMSSDWYWEQDADLRFTQFSQEIEGLWKSRTELIGKTRRELPIVFENVDREEHEAALARHEPFRGLEYRIDDGGEPRWFRINGDPIFGPDGTFLGYRGVGSDITERRRAVARLVEANREASERAKELQLTLANIVQGLTMFDAQARLVVWNQRYIELMDLQQDDLAIGMPLAEVLRRRARAGSYAADPDEGAVEFARRIAAREELRKTVRTRSGRVIAQIIAPIAGGGWVTTHEDVTERERVAERIVHAAHHDVLTGLANRASLKMNIDEALRRPDAAPFSVLLIDLDRFKAVNDTFGHAIGDQLLVEVAERMRAHVRRGDVVARLGGDEFAVLTRPGDSGSAATEQLAERLLETLIAPFSIDGREIMVGASIGVADAPAHGRDVDELLRNADTALYRVKADGRNGWRVFDGDLDAAARSRRELARDLRDALGRGEFSLHYQPIVDLGSRMPVAVETLLRWTHQRRGLVPPDVFIPLLEETGLITGVGDWVIRQACREAAALPEHIRVAVNVSPAQLRNRKLIEVVAAALAESGIGPERLEIEVTETVLLDDDEALLADLRRIKALGVKISLDDFGTGYSSLSYLRMFPFDKIKIDKSFVNDFVEREDCAAIVCSIIALARSLDMVCTAEGVETESQAAMLRAAGCDLGQGWLFARAVPMEKLDLHSVQDATALKIA